MYKFFLTKAFSKKAKKVLNSKEKLNCFNRVLTIMEVSPFAVNLKTHKVQSRKYGLMYSSCITGDLRLIWNFDQEDNLILFLLDIGGHEGKGKVYK
ncbi:hypothetical protein A2229_02970 [Candidatus Peregrinibacteria bacterium RIFOXYA2_FULL_33_7]|nr:MAG: hypothetical protein A2229_02970 [Candidatus Peregrinibacteria bacterium RIFOXYA2_FULL_33_7]